MTKTGLGLPGVDRKRSFMTKAGEQNPGTGAEAASNKPKRKSAASAMPVAEAKVKSNGPRIAPLETATQPAAPAEGSVERKSQVKAKWVSALTSTKPATSPRSVAGGRSDPSASTAKETILPPDPPARAKPRPQDATQPAQKVLREHRAAQIKSPRPISPDPATTTPEAKRPPTEGGSRARLERADSPQRPEPQQLVSGRKSPSSDTKQAGLEPVSSLPSATRPVSTTAAPVAKAESSAPSTATANAFNSVASYRMPDVEALANNVARVIELSGKALAAFMRPRETGEIKTAFADDIGEMVRSLGHVAEYYMSEPQRALEAQTALGAQFINLWAATLQRFQGASAAPVAEPDRSDKRFSDAEWRDNPYFDFIKQAYVLTTRWADDLVRRADELDPHKREKARFYLRQVTAALSPSNFVGTNPELLRVTLQESGENLVRGLKMLNEDIEAGKGNLRIRQSDARAFKLGVNLAITPGKVIFRNELIELIQYEPTTPQVFKRPLVIVPPWINKFYILDLNPEKSFIRWAVSQGLTVFVISWVNPDSRHADKGFDAYMREGVLAALEAVEQATDERDVTAIGYCVGGTLLAATLGYMAAVGDKRISSVTFFTALVDFTDAGDLKIFVDAEQLKAVEEKMAEQGYLEGSAMANAFNMLRPNDLIWSYYVNNYLKGKEPMPFDLLVWNSDSTRMPAANHKFYLRHCYLQNDLSNGRMVLGGKTIDLKKVTIPIYELATREDHIAPARGVFGGAKYFGGPVHFVLAGSGHIAGVVNPAAKPKYQYWTDGPPEGDFDSWLARANETPGSWWPDWIEWVAAQAPEKVPARKPGDGKLKPISDAPGEYVKVKA